jgi:hypothetical protein
MDFEKPIKEKSWFVKGEYLTAGLIGVLILTIFGGGIFLFHSLGSPASTETIPTASSPDVLGAQTKTPQPVGDVPQEVTDIPGPVTPVIPPKPTPKSSPSKSPTPSPSTSASPTASPSTSPSPSASSSPDISINIISPSSDANVSGKDVKVTATASGPTIDSVSLYVGDENGGNEKFISSDTSSPYEFTWDTTTTSNGKYTLKAEAKSGSQLKSASVKVNVTNSSPSPSPTP